MLLSFSFITVENPDHCDFVALRNLLIRNFMLDLVETTNYVHYENYRCRKLSGIGVDKKLLPGSAQNSFTNGSAKDALCNKYVPVSQLDLPSSKLSPSDSFYCTPNRELNFQLCRMASKFDPLVTSSPLDES